MGEELKDYKLEIDEYTFINVKFENTYDEKSINTILTETKNAIYYVFGKYYSYPSIEIMFVNKLEVNGYIINGVANPETLKITIATRNINNINKLKNCICHELIHIKFAFDNLSKIIEIINGNIAMYYINEFWACKISNNYSYVSEDSNVFKNLDLDQEVNKINSDCIENKKVLAGSICKCIIENNLIDNTLENNKKYLTLMRKIEEIGFLPTEKDISDIKNELVKLRLI